MCLSKQIVLILFTNTLYNLAATSSDHNLRVHSSTNESRADAPTNGRPATGAGMQRRRATALNFSQTVAYEFGQLARAAYCGPMDKMSTWSCDPCTASGVGIQPGSWRYVHAPEVQRNATYVLMAKLQAPAPFAEGCLLSIRGTEDRGNILRDIMVDRVPLPKDWNCTGCEVAQGWLDTWLSVEAQVISQLSSIGCAPGSKTELFVTGHSLGAAVSTLATYALTQRYKYTVRMAYVFASPRIGNKAFAEAFDEKISATTVFFRVSYHRDPVVHLPPMSWGFVHVQSEVFYDAPGEAQMCPRVEDDSCANKYYLYRPSDHCASPFNADDSLCECPGWVQSVHSLDHVQGVRMYI